MGITVLFCENTAVFGGKYSCIWDNYSPIWLIYSCIWSKYSLSFGKQSNLLGNNYLFFYQYGCIQGKYICMYANSVVFGANAVKCLSNKVVFGASPWAGLQCFLTHNNLQTFILVVDIATTRRNRLRGQFSEIFKMLPLLQQDVLYKR